MRDQSTCASIDMRIGVISIPMLPMIKEVIEYGMELNVHVSDDIHLLLNPELFEFV